MLDFFIGHYAYWFVFILMAIGLYGMTVKNNLVKKLIGMTIFQVSIILFFVAAANKWGATVPVADRANGPIDPTRFINPLPHTLMLTAIVVGVATLGVALALVIAIFKRYRTLDENLLLEEMRKEDDTE
ncbi:MAG: cation:proton antiporter subunit C [Candidatus Aminicenantes bacterium]|nr:cation:proton antiporter subunit C [Candidatus Aminicenantes bacterium]